MGNAENAFERSGLSPATITGMRRPEPALKFDKPLVRERGRLGYQQCLEISSNLGLTEFTQITYTCVTIGQVHVFSCFDSAGPRQTHSLPLARQSRRPPRMDDNPHIELDDDTHLTGRRPMPTITIESLSEQ
jgi:hypothetical protein